jgi:hypothetical protein
MTIATISGRNDMTRPALIFGPRGGTDVAKSFESIAICNVACFFQSHSLGSFRYLCEALIRENLEGWIHSAEMPPPSWTAGFFYSC